MNKDRFLAEVAALTHSARYRRMVEIGRLATSSEASGIEAAATLAALAEGTGYERRLALAAAWGSGDDGLAARHVTDPSRAARGAARRLAAHFCTDDQLFLAFEACAPRERKLALVQWCRRRRYAAIDAALRSLDARDPAEAGVLLAYASPTLIAERLAAGIDGPGLRWHALAQAHPVATAQALGDAVSRTAEPNARLIHQVRDALPVLSRARPDLALDLLTALVARVPLAGLPLRELAQRRPDAVAELCLRHVERLPFSFARLAGRLNRDLLLRLVERFSMLGGGRGDVTLWLKRRPPAERSALFARAGRGWQDSDGALSPAILELLPIPERHDEARRHLSLRVLEGRPTIRLRYAALLPWDEAWLLLKSFAGDPTPDLRALALETLAGTVRFERPRAPDLLALFAERRNEPDPVRGAMLRGLANLPPILWRGEHLEGLGILFRQALDASDLSAASASQLERLLLALLPHHPNWAAGWLATRTRERGEFGSARPGDCLSEADVRAFAPAMAPVVRAWRERERDTALIWFATYVGRRLSVFDALADALEAVLNDTPHSRLATSAIAILALHRRDRLPALVPELLRRDASAVLLSPVQDFLHRHRQDLLAPFLAGLPLTGRFASGRTAKILRFESGFIRWTPGQQGAYARGLMGLVADEARDTPALLWAVRTLAALLDVPPDALVLLADPGEKRLHLRDTALRALARRDDGDGLPTLLEALGDERARVAIYALRRPMSEMSPDTALRHLRAAPTHRVTVMKEVIRLAGEVGGTEAYNWLLQLAASDRSAVGTETPPSAAPLGKGLHRDVRIALHRAFWDFLERPDTWAVLDSAAASPDPAIAAHLARIPVEALSEATAERASRLLARLLAHPDLRVRLETFGRLGTSPLPDGSEVLLQPMLDALASPVPDERRAATSAIFATYVGRRATRIGDAARGLVGNDPALASLLAGLKKWAAADKERRAATVQAVLPAIAVHPALAGVTAELVAATLPPAALVAHMESHASLLHAEALWRSIVALAGSGRSIASLRTVERGLAGSDVEHLRRLAFAALVAQADFGWTGDLIERLEAFRADPSPLVAEAARFTFVPGEPSHIQRSGPRI